MQQPTTTFRTGRRALAAAVAAATFAIAGSAAVTSADEPSCRPREADLLRGAGAARAAMCFFQQAS